MCDSFPKYLCNISLSWSSNIQYHQAPVVHLQLHTGVQVHFLSTWKEFSDHVAMATKAVADAPFKREREKTGFSFYLESEWAGGQKVDRAGKGLLQVWKRQIQQLKQSQPRYGLCCPRCLPLSTATQPGVQSVQVRT
ncbi:hypothetical protein J4Q44_G00004280 [Coregonus suidteri]|uniref:Uncharacterized protein n=1 Tax=Coregonus suidteri TaxID=861788 RepID=A0AAN8MPT1_9TELE